MNIIPELLDIENLDLEQVNSICSLNAYYAQHCQSNRFIQSKLQDAKLRAVEAIEEKFWVKITLNCKDIRETVYYLSLFNYLNIDIHMNMFYKDYYVYRFTIQRMGPINYNIQFIGKKNRDSFNIFGYVNAKVTLVQLKLFLTHLYYNQIV